MEGKIVRHKVDGPVMIILLDELETINVEKISDGEAECFFTGKGDGTVQGAEISNETFAPIEDLVYYAESNGENKGWTHRLCSTGETLTKRWTIEEGRHGSWAAQRDGVHKEVSHFYICQRALHNIDYILAVKVNGGRWAIIGDPRYMELEFSSCGWTDENGKVHTNNYAWEMLCEYQSAPLYVFNGEIRKKIWVSKK